MTTSPKHHAALETLLEKAGIQGDLTTDPSEVGPDEANASRARASFDPAQDKPDSVFDEPLHADESFTSDDPVTLYLKEMSRVPLLSIEEELAIAIRIETGRRAKQ